MLAEYILKIISGLFVGIYVARFLGPEQFGVISYALAIVAIFMAISRLGMESILVRDLARFPESRNEIMATAFYLMLIAAIISMIILIILVTLVEKNVENKFYILVISTGMIFQAFMVVDYNFQSQIRAKYSSIAKSLALAFSAASKLFLVWFEADLSIFAIFYALDHVFIAFFLVWMHYKLEIFSFLNNFNRFFLKSLLASAWPMVLSALAVTLYMRIDQLMIKNMLGAHDLGIYAAAVKIYEGWLIIPYVISISLIPAIVKLKEKSEAVYEKKMAMLFSIMFWSSALVAVFMTFLGEYVIYYTFGADYSESISILSIIMWAAIFTSVGSITARYLTVENMEKKFATRTMLGLLVNIMFNIVLIPLYGVEGAAISTLITLIIANYLINYFDKDLRKLVFICNSSITLKWLWNEK
jgi:O-antigen/teichoic acid export membrane protein